jgi:hypothetical protein
MKKFQPFAIISLILLVGVMFTSSCKKKSTDDTTTVSNPVFVMSSTGDPDVTFYFKCTTNDVKLTKIVITDPLGLINDTYDLQGSTFLQNIVYMFNYSYAKETGTWTFKFYGNRASDGTGFVSTTTLTLSK